MFQPCLSWETENPCKFFIYKGLSSSSCTQTRWKTGPGNQGNQPGKGTGSIRRKKSDTYSVPDGTEYIKRKKEYDCNID